MKHYASLKLLQCCSTITRQTFHPRVSNCTVHNNEIWIKEFITGLRQSTACVELPLSPAQEMKIISSIWTARTDLMWPSSQLRHRILSTELNPSFDSSPRSKGKFLNIWLKLFGSSRVKSRAEAWALPLMKSANFDVAERKSPTHFQVS